MKYLLLIAFAVIQAHAQPVLYPLHVGDRWQYIYFTPPIPPPPIFSVRVARDTVMPGGSTFAVFWWEDCRCAEYWRQAGDSVFVYDPALKHDFLFFDFSRHPGDTVSSTPTGNDTMDIVMQSAGSTTMYGRALRQWSFGVNRGRHMIDDEYSLVVVDSIGVTRKHPGFGDEYNLVGAVINGIVYGTIDAVRGGGQLPPEGFTLSQNYPNPFNPHTTIRYGLPRRIHVTLSLYNTLGELVATLVDGFQEGGYHEVRFDGGGLSSGVYFYRLRAADYVETKKVNIIR
jgi:hypothetical protein